MLYPAELRAQMVGEAILHNFYAREATIFGSHGGRVAVFRNLLIVPRHGEAATILRFLSLDVIVHLFFKDLEG